MSNNQDGFFAVNKDNFYNACNLGLNAGIAYLVIASGTGGSNTVSSWSCNAIERRTGISRSRAKKAVLKLVENNVIKQTKSGTNPQYRLMDGRKVKTLSSDHVIWLPNGIVQSVMDETSPLERIRQTQDNMCLRLFVDLYAEQNLIEDGGVSRNVTFDHYEKLDLGRCSQYNVYGFRSDNQVMTWGTETTKVHRRESLTDEEKEQGKNKGIDFFKRFGALKDAGIVSMVPHLFDSDTDEAEIIHSLGDDTEMEQKITQAANCAARNMITDSQLNRAHEMGFCEYLVPIPRHAINAQLIGIARLRYKPKTSMTKAWFAESVKRNEYALNAYLQHQGDIKVASR
jgi:DNA-binding Lrp family transcriptional regulator